MKHFDFSKEREKEIHLGKTAYMEEVGVLTFTSHLKKNQTHM